MAIDGTPGNDSLTGTSLNDTINGFGGNDTLNALAGSDSLDGGDGNDSLLGGDGSDTLLGGAGQDTLVGGDFNDFIDGGVITDLVNYTDLNWVRFDGATTGVQVNLQTGSALDGLNGTDTLVNINFVTGTQFNDTITGSSTSFYFESFEAGEGNDLITGGTIDASNNFAANRINYLAATQAVNVNLGSGLATRAGQRHAGRHQLRARVQLRRHPDRQRHHGLHRDLRRPWRQRLHRRPRRHRPVPTGRRHHWRRS
jgi:hypothetical protein